MKYTVEQKAYLMAIQNPDRVYAIDCDDVVLIVNGYIGYYINKRDLLIDVTKLQKAHKGNKSTDDLKPKNIIKSTVPAHVTRIMHLMPNGEIAIKIKSDDDKKAWVNTKFLKAFGNNVNFRISSERDAIYISYFNDIPAGVVMPMRISNEEVED